MMPAHWTTDDMVVNGATIHTIRTGDGSKPPLVLAHGFSDDGLCWLQAAIDLESRYDIIMPDARGHGLSSRVQPGAPVDMVADLAGVIQALGLHRPVVCGHSMGAMVAFQLGVRYPEIPSALLLEDPPWWQPETRQPVSQPAEHPMAPWVATITRLTLDELIEQTRREHPTWPEWVIQTWCPAKKRVDPRILSILNISGDDWAEGIPQLTCPTLIVTADPARGGIVTSALAERAQQLSPRCAIAHIPGVGHHIHFEAYDAFMQHINAFLRAHA